jgi:transposase
VIPHGVEVFVGLDPIDLRWGFDRLCGIVAERLGRGARCGALFVFFGRRRTALKALYFDGTGLCVLYKRLDEKTFRLPAAPDDAKVIAIDERAFDALLDGIEIEASKRLRRRRVIH